MTNAFWTDYVPSDRDILITKVQQGELTPEEAESEASRLGLGPFKVNPNPSDFDPMSETTWSLPMVLAWIKRGTPEAAREMWDSYREKFRYWFFQRWQVPGGPIYDGHFLKTPDPAGLYDVAILDRSSTAPNRHGIESYLDACRALSNGAQRANWKASGVPTDGSPRREIEPFEWPDFEICDAKDGSGLRHAVLRDRQRGAFDIGYNSVLVPVPGFLKSFRATAEPKSKRGRPPTIQYDVLKSEFLRLMDHHGDLSSDDPDWKSNDNVIEALQRFYSEKRKAEASRTALQPKVNEWLEDWRRSEAATK